MSDLSLREATSDTLSFCTSSGGQGLALWRFTLVTITVALATSFLLPAVAAAQPAEAIAPGAVSSSPPRWMGSPSCSAQACHGDVKADQAVSAIGGNEHTVWIQADKHSRAYEVLWEPLSIRIAERLGLSHAHQAQECLVCHAPREAMAKTNPHAVDKPFPPEVLGEGVGCESCHGPAEKWLEPHTRRPLTALEKKALGMNDTEDLHQRAKLCAECHIGSGAPDIPAPRDVNHDLIAAGHPPLRYEFGAFLAQMPKHWEEKRRDPTDPRKLDAAFEVRLWAVGQASSAAAALELLADRARGSIAAVGGDAEQTTAFVAGRERPWPEFAEYDCFACHHDLQADSWRRQSYAKRAVAKGNLGAPTWGTWYYPLLPVVTSTGTTPAGIAPPEFDALRALMGKPGGDRSAIEQQARAAARSLDTLASGFAKAPWDRARLNGLLCALTETSTGSPTGNWDSAAQRYLALVAIRLSNRALPGAPVPDDKELAPLVRQLYDDLKFPAVEAAHPERRYESPHNYQPDNESKLLGQIRRLLKPATP